MLFRLFDASIKSQFRQAITRIKSKANTAFGKRGKRLGKLAKSLGLSEPE